MVYDFYDFYIQFRIVAGRNEVAGVVVAQRNGLNIEGPKATRKVGAPSTSGGSD